MIEGRRPAWRCLVQAMEACEVAAAQQGADPRKAYAFYAAAVRWAGQPASCACVWHSHLHLHRSNRSDPSDSNVLSAQAMLSDV